MKNYALSITLAAVFCFIVNGALASIESPRTLDRNALAKKATEDRLAYVASPEYNPYETESRDLKKTATELLEKKKYSKAIAHAKKGLTFSKYDIDLLILLASAYRESGDIQNADKIREQWMSLVDSILESGNGREFKTAFQVISVSEEYAVLRVLGLQPTRQSVVPHESSSFDVMQVKDPRSGKDFTFYFNIDLPKKWLGIQLSRPTK